MLSLSTIILLFCKPLRQNPYCLCRQLGLLFKLKGAFVKETTSINAQILTRTSFVL